VIIFYKRKRIEGISEGLNEGINGGLNEGINRLYDYIKGHPKSFHPEIKPHEDDDYLNSS
jgi:hypothetical protein